jgi:hypothetical protein
MRPNTPTTDRPDARQVHPRPDSLLSRLNRFGVDNGGATAVIGAILFPVVVGGLGLGAETGYWYLTQRKLQHVADVSAYAAGARLRADDSYEKIVAAARHVARESGYKGTPELEVNTPYPHETFDDDKLVEVVASETQPRLFSAVVARIFSSDPDMTVTMSARAVGMVEAGAGTVACVLALSPTASRAVSMDGSGSVNLEGCDIASNSNAADALYATSTVSTDCAYSVGGAQAPGLTTNLCDKVKTNQPLIRDPYADVVEPTNPGNCKNRNQGHPSQPSAPLTPGCYDGLTVKGELHFEPGVYYINGGEFNVNAGDNSKLTGTGVTIYLANGARLNIGGSIQMNFSAPGPGEAYEGIVIFGERSGTAVSHKLAGGSGSDYTGAIYTPNSLIEFAGNSKATGGGCTQVIGAKVKFTGASALKSTCQDAGTTGIATAEVVKLIE